MFDIPFSLLTLQHFGPTWEGMFWLQGLNKDIFVYGYWLKQCAQYIEHFPEL